MDVPSPARPMRADARRNYERIVECAREAFADDGPDAPLDDIARRAAVGPGTLYRHFPNREALIEAVYRDSIERLSERAYELLESRSPAAAIEQWMREQVAFVLDRRSLATTLKALIDHESATFTLCRTSLNNAAGALLKAGQEAKVIRADIEPRDLLRLGHGIGVACEKTPEAAERLLGVTLDGLRIAP
ncbi:TetR family transcriptional regulator [Nocardia tenerifensis]|uniref:TetR family transcriptional regulator n=1 Tax=Nocardia tenerifensis TaxID=228006 RepID=A0A318K0P4_9NOCA|nr:TetR/AcrR family transcriptional regulator [Nocardia tenerifensis]PXX61541.1 TetR family transcriptional regulator [Nocardia tenerifensis]